MFFPKVPHLSVESTASLAAAHRTSGVRHFSSNITYRSLEAIDVDAAARSFLSSNEINIAVTINENPSATGPAATTPQSPQMRPKMSMHGMSAIHCRNMDSMIEVFGRPVTTNILLDTI
jgi:hypothetical protein